MRHPLFIPKTLGWLSAFIRARVLVWTKRRPWTFAEAAVLAAAVVLSGCSLPEEPQATPAAAALPVELVDTAGPHTIAIERRFEGSLERRMLEMAEATFPPRDSIALRGGGQRRPAEDLPPGDTVWWASSFDGIRIPYAITGSAVRYYMALTRAFRQGDFDVTSGIEMQSSDMVYTAEVARHPVFERDGQRFTDVYVVQMELAWSNYCGMLCAMKFTHDRTVVLSPSGQVRAVFGDGYPRVIVS